MPINPTIALGAQQQQPINMLGQLGQLYALKAARQEVEGGENVRDFFAQGGDLTTPEGQRAIMTAAPKLGGQLIKQQADIRKTQIDTLKDEIGIRRDALSEVRTPEEYLAWHKSNHTGALGNFFKSAGINPSTESIMAELAKPGGLERLKRESALGATKLQQELMQTERTYGAAAISAAPGHRQADLAYQKFNRDVAQEDAVVNLLRGGAPAPTGAPATAPTAAPTGGGARGPAPAAGPVAAPVTGTAPATGGSVNALAPNAAPSTNALAPTGAAPTAPVAEGDVYARIDAIDAQIRQLSALGTPKAIAAAQLLNSQRTQLLQSAKQQYTGQLVDVVVNDPANPGKTITIKGRTNQYGGITPVEMGEAPLSTNASATGGTTISPTVARAPLTPGQERNAETARVKEEGQKTVNTVLGTLYQQYSGLVNQGGITDTSKGTIANLKASAGSNVVGQAFGGAVGAKAQEFRDSIEQTRPLLLNAIKNATGMSAQQLNSNVELQTYLKAATDPKLSIQANIKAMNNISTLFGLGEEFKIPVPEKKSSAAPKESSSGVALPKGFKLDN